MASLSSDLRLAVRGLARTPGFTAAAVLLLALGISMPTTVFSIFHGLLLRPLPYPEPQRLVALHQTTAQEEQDNFSAPNFVDLRERARAFESLAVYTGYWNPALTGRGEAVRVDGALVSAQLFQVLGARAQRGRTFGPEADRPGQPDTAVVSHAFGKAHLAGDPRALGQTLTLNGQPFTVIGVMAPDFQPPAELAAEVWGSLTVDAASPRTGRSLRALGRLAPGVSLAQARADLDAVAEGLVREHPAELTGFGFTAVPLRDQLFGATRKPLLLLLGAAGVLLLIACTNLSGLLLARGAARGREMAIRAALGAGRGRLARQLLVESALLAALGAAAGVVLAAWALDLLVALGPEQVRMRPLTLDVPGLLFALGAALASVLLAGVVPALRVSQAAPQTVLQASSLTVSARGGLRARSALIVLQLSLSLALLVGAGLLARSFVRLLQVDPGFLPERLLTLSLQLPQARYGGDSRKHTFTRELRARVEALPGVRGAAWVSTLPLGTDDDRTGLFVVGETYAHDSQAPVADRYRVSAGYLELMGIPLERGRRFGAEDRSDTRPAVIVDEVLARHLWPGQDAVGRQLRLPAESQPRTVVGVVGEVKQEGLDREGRGQLYLPLSQDPTGFLKLVVRTEGEPLALASSVAREVRAVDPELPVAEVRTMESLMGASTSGRRFLLTLLAAFAAAALVVAALGLHGVVAYAVRQQERDIGIRMALGASSQRVVAAVLRDGAGLALRGVVLGLAIALPAARLLGGSLFGITSTDPLTLALACVLLLGVALLACYLPARRASTVDPAVVLRSE